MALRSLLILGAVGVQVARGQGEQLQSCGSAPYYASEYTCFDNKTLCPRLYGEPTLPCGGACYSPYMYRCAGDAQLQLLPAHGASRPAFKLEAHSSNPALDKRLAKVCNLQFNVGADAETCVYCYDAPPRFVCSSYQNETVLLPSGAMSVDVPGSQYWFVDPVTGRLKTTAAGKGGAGGVHAGEGVTMYEQGYFSRDGSSYWLACKEPGGTQRYGIFAPTGNSDRTDCERIKLVVVPSTEPKEGAYAYT